MTVEYTGTPSVADGGNLASIDFGTDNFAAIVATDGSSAIYKGGAVLSENHFFAKKRAKAVAVITKGHERMHAVSHYLDRLSAHHENFVKDQMHKISRSIIGFCKKHDVSVLVLGQNKLWKQRTAMRSTNNQKFVQMSVTRLMQMIEYKAVMAGIVTVCIRKKAIHQKLLSLTGTASRLMAGTTRMPCSAADGSNADCTGAKTGCW